MKKTGLFLSLVLATSTFLGACGTTKETGEKDTAEKKENKFKVGMVTDTGGVDDKSFNQSAWEGMQRLGKEEGLEEGKGYKYLQSNSDSEYVPNLTTFAEGGYNLTYGIGFLLADHVGTVAKQYPNQQFAIVDSVVEGDNVTSITFKEHQGSFLVGVLAALNTKTNKVGFIGGVKSDLISKFEVGFRAGVKSVNPKVEIISQYADSFVDTAKGTSIASAMYGQKVDIIYHAAGNVGNGVFTEAKNRAKKGEKVWVIGVDRDQHNEGMPENVTLTSMVKRVDNAVFEVSKKALDGTLKGGEIVEFGLEEKGVGIAPTTSNLQEGQVDKVKEYEEKILSGEIKVPSSEKEYTEFEKTLK
ncbi:MAG: basic rane lipoprotein [Bacillales bacterium]|nr:basic rane lipoprotein [Bacillales bacterium]